MNTKEEALEIARSEVPDLDEREWCFISQSIPNEARIGIGFKAPEEVWTVTYSPFKKGTGFLGHCSCYAVIIDGKTGRVTYKGDINDEG